MLPRHFAQQRRKKVPKLDLTRLKEPDQPLSLNVPESQCKHTILTNDAQSMLKLLEHFRPGAFAVTEDFVCSLPPECTQDDFHLLECHEYGKREMIEAETSQAEKVPRPKVFERKNVTET